MTEETVTYIDVPLLKKLNRKAIAKRYNRSLTNSFLNELDESLKLPVVWSLEHNHEMRLKLACANPFRPEVMIEVWIDVSFKDYMALPKETIVTNTRSMDNVQP